MTQEAKRKFEIGTKVVCKPLFGFTRIIFVKVVGYTDKNVPVLLQLDDNRDSLEKRAIGLKVLAEAHVDYIIQRVYPRWNKRYNCWMVHGVLYLWQKYDPKKWYEEEDDIDEPTDEEVFSRTRNPPTTRIMV